MHKKLFVTLIHDVVFMVYLGNNARRHYIEGRQTHVLLYMSLLS